MPTKTINQINQLNRRDFLDFPRIGLGGAAFLSLLQPPVRAVQHERPLHPVAKAKRAIHICLIGGFSQVDSFDYRPELERLHGQPLPGSMKPQTFNGNVGLLRKGEWNFQRRGKSGLWVSDLFPHLAGVADELTVIRSMVADTSNHMPAMFQENCGFQSNGYPSLGSWLSYGLGNLSESLPTFVVLPDARSLPNGGSSNWSNGFLPAAHQGTPFASGTHPVRNLVADERLSEDAQADALGLLNALNRSHLAAQGDNDLLKARVRAYELAARMQVSVPEAIDFSQETAAIKTAYGFDRGVTADCAQRCLLARRLLERGVRFVQIFSGGAFGGSPRHSWDGHEDNRENHLREANMIDQPIAALLSDLRQRGMLEDTLILCTSEFGRTPFTQSNGTLGLGRDHNPEGFTCWMAGAGLRPGFAYGETDPVGWRAVENPITWPDFHATVLHLLGLNHEALTYYHNGIDRRLTNVHGRVVKEILA